MMSDKKKKFLLFISILINIDKEIKTVSVMIYTPTIKSCFNRVGDTIIIKRQYIIVSKVNLVCTCS